MKGELTQYQKNVIKASLNSHFEEWIEATNKVVAKFGYVTMNEQELKDLKNNIETKLEL